MGRVQNQVDRLRRYLFNDRIKELSPRERDYFEQSILEKNLFRCCAISCALTIYQIINIVVMLVKDRGAVSQPYYFIPMICMLIVSVIVLVSYSGIKRKSRAKGQKRMVLVYYFTLIICMSVFAVGDMMTYDTFYLNYAIVCIAIATLPMLPMSVIFTMAAIPFLTVAVSTYYIHAVIFNEPVLMFIATIIFSFLFTHSAYMQEVSRIKAESSSEIVGNQLEKQIEHYHSLESYLTELRGYKHDMKNHFLALAAMIKEGKNDEALMYINDISDILKSSEDIFNTGNQVLDSILTAKKQLAKDHGIEFRKDIHIPPNIMIEPVDMCNIMGNLLDNAIEACQRSGTNGTFVEVSLAYTKGFFIGRIKNSSKVAPVRDDDSDLFVTSKVDFANHGFGMKHIQNGVHKYGGEFNAEQQDDVFVAAFNMKAPVADTVTKC